MKSIKLKKYYVWPIGCAQNISDSERVASVLESMGYVFTQDEKEADVICALACSVKQTAIDRIHGRAKNWRTYKKQPLKLLSGCVLPRDKAKMEKIFDVVFEIKDLARLPELINSRGLSPDISKNYFSYLSIKPKHKNSFQALVPISNGCDNFCSYCAVPYARGREVSRPMKEIITEIKELVANGYKEIMLLGQNVNSYGNSIKDKESGCFKNSDGVTPFHELLKELNKIGGDFWIRYYSSHPKDFSDELIKDLPNLKKVTTCIHLPVQSGSDKILKAMNRKYTRATYLDLVDKIKDNIPNVALSTDTIVGFPNESEDDFQDTITLYEEVGFDMAYISKYSPRLGTVSAKLQDNVTKEEKDRRLKVLTAVLAKTAQANNEKYLGQTARVLIEKIYKGEPWGRTDTYKNVKVLYKGSTLVKSDSRLKSPEELIGTFQEVKIVNATPWFLEGEII